MEPGPKIEILAPPLSVPQNRLIALPRPFSDYRIDTEMPAGMTIEEMLIASKIDPTLLRFAHVWLSDPNDPVKDPVHIRREYWHLVRPKPGIVITLRAAPMGGGGGKGALGIVLRVVVVVIAAVATWYLGGAGGPLVLAGMSTAAAAATASVAGAAIGMTGALNIARSLPPLAQGAVT